MTHPHDEAMLKLRNLHRRGTREFSTGLAYSRAAANLDWVALLALTEGLQEDDDLVGLVVILALIAGRALNIQDQSAHEILDDLSSEELERRS